MGKKCKKDQKVIKHKKKKRRSSVSSCNSSASSTPSLSTIDEETKKKLVKIFKKQRKKKKQKIKEKKEKLLKKFKTLKYKSKCGTSYDSEIKDFSGNEGKAIIAPMSKAEWEKQQNTLKRVLDEESGRIRLVYLSILKFLLLIIFFKYCKF